VQVWDPATGDLLAELAGAQGDVEVLLGAPDGSWLASAGWTGHLRVWDARTWTVLAELPTDGGSVRAMAAPDARTLVTTGIDGVVRVWDLAAVRPVGSLRVAGPLVHAAVAGRLLVAGGVDAVHLNRIGPTTCERRCPEGP
jgi:WD40 repeat protein